MPVYKLTYFNAKGLAELARIMFAQKGVEYEDIRVDREQWEEMKAKTPFGKLPLLQVDDEVFPQSKAFSRYLAREFEFYGSSSYEMARIDVVTETIDDLLQGLRKCMIEQDEEQKAKLLADYYDEKGQGPTGMQHLAGLLGEKDYFVGDKISLADFCMLIAGDWYQLTNKEAMDGFPTLVAHRQRLMALPNIAAWIEKRPNTDY